MPFELIDFHGHYFITLERVVLPPDRDQVLAIELNAFDAAVFVDLQTIRHAYLFSRRHGDLLGRAADIPKRNRVDGP